MSKDEQRFIAACHAMQGMIEANIKLPTYSFTERTLNYARSAVEYADALLAELEKEV